MISIEFRATKLGVVRRNIDQLGKNLTSPEIIIAMSRRGIDITNKAREYAPEAWGKLKNSFSVTTTYTPGKNIYTRIKNTAPYSGGQEIGQPPHIVPLQRLHDWVLIKKITSSEQEAWRIAERVQSKIKFFGTLGYFYMKRALKELGDVGRKRIEEAVKETIRRTFSS